MIVTAFQSSTACHSVSSGLQGRQMFSRCLVGIPSAKIEFSSQWARLGRCDRECLVFLGLSDIEVSSRLPASSMVIVPSPSIVRGGHAASSYGSLLLKVPLLSCPRRDALHSKHRLWRLRLSKVARTGLHWQGAGWCRPALAGSLLPRHGRWPLPVWAPFHVATSSGLLVQCVARRIGGLFSESNPTVAGFDLHVRLE